MKIHPTAFLLIAFSGPAPLRAVERYDHGALTVYEQLILEMVNRARANPAAEAARLGIGLNDGLPAGTISPDPKPPLAPHPALTAAARGHTRWMLDTGTFSHTGAGGSEAGDRMRAAGYVFSGSWIWGENISWGGTSGTPDLLAQTIARHDNLFKSAGHRTNLCSEDFRQLGPGLMAGRFNQLNAAMLTQKFARSASHAAPLVTGAVFEDRDGDAFYDPGEELAGVTVTPEESGWEAVTSSSGGYAVPYSGNTGALTVVFSGGPLPRPVRRTMMRTGANVKMDLTSASVPFVEIVPGSMTHSESGGFSLRASGTAGLGFHLQRSADLRFWEDVSSHQMGAGPMTLTHRAAPGPGGGFYRLRW